MVALDHGRALFEVRVCQRNSEEALGNDADRLEFRYRDANNQIDVKCARASVPSTWLVVSHISGPTLLNAINSTRAQGARIEGPEQIEQFGQLAAVHRDWMASSARPDAVQGIYRSQVAMAGQGNFHLIAGAHLIRHEPEVVRTEALAMRGHNQQQAVLAPTGPPAVTGPAMQAATRRLGGQARLPAVPEAMAYDPVRLLMAESDAPHEVVQPPATTAAAEPGEEEQEVDQAVLARAWAADAARSDMSQSVSSVLVTPGMFAEAMSRRVQPASTTEAEEIPQDE